MAHDRPGVPPRPHRRIKHTDLLRHRLRRRWRAWKAHGAGRRTVGWLRGGVNLETQWKDGPPRPFNQGESMRELDSEEQAWLEAETARLFASGAWEPAECHQYISKAFLVPKKSDELDHLGQPVRKFRLVIDLRHLNSFCQDYTVKYQTLATLSRWGVKGSYGFSWDLMDGYHAIGIRRQDKKYFTMNLQGRLIQIAVLPFGWSGSCTVFCHTMETFVSALRSPGLVSGPQAAKQSEATRLTPLVVAGRRYSRWGALRGAAG